MQPTLESALLSDRHDDAAIRFANELENLSQDRSPEPADIDLQSSVPDTDTELPGTKSEPEILGKVPETEARRVASISEPDRMDQASETKGPIAKTSSAEIPLVEFAPVRIEPIASPRQFSNSDGTIDAPILPDAAGGEVADGKIAGAQRVPELDRLQSPVVSAQEIVPRDLQNAARTMTRPNAVTPGTVAGPRASTALADSATEIEQVTKKAPDISGQTVGASAGMSLSPVELQTHTQFAPQIGARMESAETRQVAGPVAMPDPSGKDGSQAVALGAIENLIDPDKPRVDAPASRELDPRNPAAFATKVEAPALLSPEVLGSFAATDPKTQRGLDPGGKLNIVQGRTAEPLDSFAEQPRKNGRVVPAPLPASDGRTTASLGGYLQTSVVEAEQPTETGMKPDSMQVVTDVRLVQLTPQKAGLAQSVVRQLVTTVQHIQGGPVEISLNPEELGKVRLAISNQESTAITVSITAERPETLALVRRHADQLTQEFHTLGYSDVTYSFDQNDHSDSEAPPGVRKPPQTLPDATQQDQPTEQIHLVTSTGLDIRL